MWRWHKRRGGYKSGWLRAALTLPQRKRPGCLGFLYLSLVPMLFPRSPPLERQVDRTANWLATISWDCNDGVNTKACGQHERKNSPRSLNVDDRGLKTLIDGAM